MLRRGPSESRVERQTAAMAGVAVNKLYQDCRMARQSTCGRKHQETTDDAWCPQIAAAEVATKRANKSAQKASAAEKRAKVFRFANI
jgi:hypothetical protein